MHEKKTSFVFPPSSFWSLAAWKNGGRRPGIFYHMNDVSVYLGRQRRGGVPDWENAFCVLHFEPGVVCVCFLLHERFKLQCLGKKLHQAHSTHGGPLPPSVYLGRHWHHSCDKMDHTSLSVFAYCKRSKTGQWEGLGTRLKTITCGDVSGCVACCCVKWGSSNTICHVIIPNFYTKIKPHIVCS